MVNSVDWTRLGIGNHRREQTPSMKANELSADIRERTAVGLKIWGKIQKKKNNSATLKVTVSTMASIMYK